MDRATSGELLSTGEFEVMTLEADEDEHSIEMHLPYVARVMESRRDQVGGLERLYSTRLVDLYIGERNIVNYSLLIRFQYYQIRVLSLYFFIFDLSFPKAMTTTFDGFEELFFAKMVQFRAVIVKKISFNTPSFP